MVAVPLLLALLVCQPGTGLGVLLAVATPLVLPLLVCEPGTGMCVLLAVAVPLLPPLLVCQPGTGLCVLLMVAVPLLLPLLVCQPGTGLCVLLVVAVLLLLPGYGGHASVVVALHLSCTHGAKAKHIECLDCSICKHDNQNWCMDNQMQRRETIMGRENLYVKSWLTREYSAQQKL